MDESNELLYLTSRINQKRKCRMTAHEVTRNGGPQIIYMLEPSESKSISLNSLAVLNHLSGLDR